MDAVPAGVPPQAADSARDTLGGATGVADQLPAALVAVAGEAFTDGLRIAAAFSVVGGRSEPEPAGASPRTTRVEPPRRAVPATEGS